MKWLGILLMTVIAIVLALFGVLASADPQGRGDHLADILFRCAFTVLLMAVFASMYLGDI